jgi:ParB family chromosome partitioning protein
VSDEFQIVLSPPEERALRVIDNGDWLLAGRTDGNAYTIHARVAEARKGLFRLPRRADGARLAALTTEGEAAAARLAATPAAAAPDAEANARTIRPLPLLDVYPNPAQPRTIFREADLDELGESIRTHGLLQPIKVRADGKGRYMIVLGERRWRAHQRIGAETIEATVVDLADDALADAAIVENLQRKDITPLEEARAFQARLATGLTIDELAKRLGIRQPRRIAERVALLQLAGEYQEALTCGVLNPSQAGEMARLSPASQRVLFQAIRAGRCKTYAELRSVAQGLLDAENQTEMFPNERTTDDERRAVYGLEQKIDRVCDVLGAGFEDNDIVILRKVNPLKADVIADKLEVIEASLKRLRLALRASAIARAAKESAAA